MSIPFTRTFYPSSSSSDPKNLEIVPQYSNLLSSEELSALREVDLRNRQFLRQTLNARLAEQRELNQLMGNFSLHSEIGGGQ